MKRDLDLGRKILLKLEELPYNLGGHHFELEGYSPDQINYHLTLLEEAGLIEAINVSSHDGIGWLPQRLTWSGHDFLEASKDESRWEKAKRIVVEKGGGIAFDVLKKVLITLMTKDVLG